MLIQIFTTKYWAKTRGIYMNKIKLGGITIISLLFILNSCTDEPLQVGLNLLPDTDLLTAAGDTLQIEGYTIKGFLNYTSSSNAANSSTDQVIPLGVVNDPTFGRSTAELTLQLNYNNESHYTFDDDAVSDKLKSFKLYLHIDQTATFGSDESFETFAYPLTKQIVFPQDYTSSFGLTFTPSYKMKSEDFDFNTNLSNLTDHNIYVSNSKIPDLDSNNFYLVIDLDTSYYSQLMDTSFIADNNLYSTQLNFTNQFPGLYIQSSETNSIGGIESFYVTSSYAILEYDRTYKDQNQNDSILTQYQSYNIAKYICMYEHESNYSPYGGPFSDFLGDTLNIQENFYIQSLGGVRGFIHLSELHDFRDKNTNAIGINLAEIIMPVDKDYIDTTSFYLPKRIAIQEYVEEFKNGYSIIDDGPAGSGSPGYFVGFLDEETMEYRINVTEYAHRYMQDSISTGWLYVLPSLYNQSSFTEPNYKSPERAVFNNSGTSNRPFLRIIYTYTNY